MNEERNPYKKEVLRIVMSILDQLDFIAPFILSSKLLMQEIWRSSIKWNDKIKAEEKIS
jgi:hypothetical protein